MAKEPTVTSEEIAAVYKREEKIEALSKPLDESLVKQRKQGSFNVSYVEAWHIIKTANDIFGYDGWTRETFDTNIVSERPTMIGREPNLRAGFRVTYTARVRVTATLDGENWTAREGTGAGHGIDTDPGIAHESAIKEAESDAMKRAMITFGSQFGLSLYDKDRAGKTEEESIDSLMHPSVPKHDFQEIINSLGGFINNSTTVDQLTTVWSENLSSLEKIREHDRKNYDTMVERFKYRKAHL